MPESTLAGHPLHPMLSVAPAPLLPSGFLMDALHRSTGKKFHARAAYYSLVGGLLGGLATGTAGAMDCVTLPSETGVKRTVKVHAALNVGTLALRAANVAGRRNKPEHKGGLLASSAGLCGH